MPIRTKIVLISFLVVTLYVGLDFVLQRTIIRSSFEILERQQAQRDIERCLGALRREIHHLDQFCSDWAARDDTYAYVQEANGKYEASNLVPSTFIDNALNLLYLLNERRHVLSGAIYDIEQAEPLVMPDFPLGTWPESHPLLRHRNEDDRTAGLILTSRGIMLVSSRPISSSNAEGPLRGTLIMGRFLDDRFMDMVSEQTQVSTRLRTIEAGRNDAQGSNHAPRLDDTPAIHFNVQDEHRLRACAVVSDVFGKPVFQLSADLPREITEKGNAATRMDTLAALAVALVSLLILIVLMRRTVIEPLSRLTSHISRIGASGALSLIDMPLRSDEFHVLAREFNTMVRRLRNDATRRERAEEALRESQRLAELGELGASVAHEIRNPLAGISSAIQVIRGGFPPQDPRRNVIEQALQQVTRVEQTVRQLLRYASPWDPIKRSADLRRFAAAACESISARHGFSKHAVSVEPGPPLIAPFDAALLEQVLENLMLNAAHAMPDGGELEIAFSEDDRAARIHVRDQGPGFGADALPRAFEPFYTSKAKGTGLGLSVCRRILTAHGGSIRAENHGGKGAEIILELPK